MPPKSRLVRPDGSIFEIEPEKAAQFEALGYRPMEMEELVQEQGAIGQDNYWSSGSQKLATAAEGLASGLTVGLSDAVLDAFGAEDFKTRGQYNPGTRLASEIVGGLLPLVPGASALKFAPAGALMNFAGRTGKAATASRVGQVAAAGAIEGAGVGAGSALSEAIIQGDPITTEAIAAGIGWGAFFGGGLGALAGKAGSVIESRAAAQAASEAQAAATSDAWRGFRSSVDDINGELNRAIKQASSSLDNAKAELKLGGRQFDDAKRAYKAVNELGAEMSQDVVGRAKGAVDEAKDIRNGLFNQVPDSLGLEFKANKKAGIAAFKDMQRALAAKDYAALEKAQKKFSEHVANINSDLDTLATRDHGRLALEGSLPSPGAVTPFKAGSGAFEPMHIESVRPFEDMTLKGADRAFKEITSLAKASAGLRAMPSTMDDFAKMTAVRAEKLFGSADALMKTSTPEFAGARDAFKQGLETLQESFGLKIDGPPATQLRGLWEAARESSQRATTDTVARASKGVVPWLQRQASFAMGREFAKRAPEGSFNKSFAYGAGRALTMGLVGLKSAVVGSISKAALEWAPRAAAKLGPRVGRIEPLATRLNGMEDAGTTDRKALMTARSAEIREAAGSVRDTLYKHVAPLAEAHPELASAMHAHGVKRFEFILNKLPKDPGMAFSRLQTLWKPDNVATEKFSRYYEVFQNPVAVVQEILKTGRVLPEWAEGLREMDPALFTHLRVEMLNKLSDPAVMGKLSYPEQVSMGMLLDLPLHSTMTPRFVATQQQMFEERNQKLPMPPQPGASNGGRPPGAANSKGASPAQKITDH
jgi:hypothetical protein